MTEVVLRPALDTAELRAVAPDWPARVADHDLAMTADSLRVLRPGPGCPPGRLPRSYVTSSGGDQARRADSGRLDRRFKIRPAKPWPDQPGGQALQAGDPAGLDEDRVRRPSGPRASSRLVDAVDRGHARRRRYRPGITSTPAGQFGDRLVTRPPSGPQAARSAEDRDPPGSRQGGQSSRAAAMDAGLAL